MLNNELEIKLEKLRQEQVSQVAEIEKQCFSCPWSENSISEQLENELSDFIVATYYDKVIGYISGNTIYGECYINNVAVNHEFRKKRVGSKLVNALIEEVSIKNGEFITLEVRKSNCKAISLYTNCGFENCGERKNYYSNPTENALIMTKYLKSTD